MRRVMVGLLICLVLNSQITPASAWSDAGHRVVALIAWAQLNEEVRQRVFEILQAHPRFEDDFEDEMPDDVPDDEESQRRWLITQAATWSDLVRSGPSERTSNNRPKWHYINLPIFLSQVDEDALAGQLSVNLELDLPQGVSGTDSDLNVIQAIKLCEDRLGNPHISDRTKALYLCWLCHLVGDLHQPLHSSALFSRVQFPQGDKGGNSIRVGTGNGSKLHSRWDRLLGGTVAFNRVQSRAAELSNDSAMQRLGAEAAAALSPETWLDESHTVAKDVVYTEEILEAVTEAEFNRDEDVEVIPLDDEYFETAGAAARKRVVQAGYRLAAMLERLSGSADESHAPGAALAVAPNTDSTTESTSELNVRARVIAAKGRTAKVKTIDELRVMPVFDSDGNLAGFNIIAIAMTDDPGWTNGRLIPHTPPVNPDDNYLRFDFVADAPPSGGSGNQHFVVAQDVVPDQGAVGVEVFASTNSMRRGEGEFKPSTPAATSSRAAESEDHPAVRE